MKYLKPFALFEKLDISSEITIDELLEEVNVGFELRPQIIEWWKENRSEIHKIYYFAFETDMPIAGVFLGSDSILVNSRMKMPPHIKLFLALHESRHCDQHRAGILMEGYFNSVVNDDKPTFMTTYRELEADANDFAIQSMREIGFSREMDIAERQLRGNENAGEIVYKMMKSDIQKFEPVDFFDLLKKQVGIS